MDLDVTLDGARAPARSIAWSDARVAAIALVVSIACVTRLVGLGAASFSEDEINKLRAIEAYDRGDFTANAEHPMLMKLAMWWSMHAAQATHVAPEAALRLPNAVAGAATTAVLFLLAESLFDTAVGGWAALLWAVDMNAAAINRIGKEDSFLLLFLLLGVYWFERAKAAPPAASRERDRWYRRSAAAFGLMAASKYMPHYFGLHALFNVAADRNPADKTPDKRWWFYAIVGLSFLIANVAVLLPATWTYLGGYVRGDTVRHSGYLFAGRLYVNTIGSTPWGLPPAFYLVFLGTKVPLAVLAAAIVGLVWMLRHHTHRGAAFVRVFLVFTLLPYSLVSSKFLRYALPLLALVDIAAALGITLIFRRIRDSAAGGRTRPALIACCGAAMIVPSALQWRSAAPHLGTAQNLIGASLTAQRWLFPDDEIYDAGLREAVRWIDAAAGRSAVICSDAPAVVAEYLARDGRHDVRSCSISHDGLPMGADETWVIVQDGHTYFENRAVIDTIAGRSTPSFTIRIGGRPAVAVYRFK